MKKKIIFLLVALFVIENFSSFTVASTESHQMLYEKSSHLLINKKNLEYRNIEKNIVSLIQNKTNKNDSVSFPYKNLDFVGNKVRLEVILTGEEQLDSLSKFSDTIEIENHYKALAQILLPIDQIFELSQKEYVQFIRSPIKPIPTTTSEGVAKIGADLVQAKGFNGEGVKIAVIDIGFEGYSTNPDLPSARIKEATSYRADHDLEYDDHGAACAEIVLDVAPQADLYLYNFETISELNNAVSRAITVGVDIISFSIGYTYINNFDGIGYSGIGDVCSIVNNARSQGILFVVAAGNEADHHYEGTWKDSNSNNWHEFSGSDEELNLGYLTAGTLYYFELTWNDWPFSDQDYDLVLFDSSFNVVDWSADPQTGSQPPEDWILNLIPYSDSYYLDIYKWDATQTVDFELYGNDDIPFPEYNHPESSLTCPADAAGATSVGATYWHDDSLEFFSSRGPTNDGRTKPDITSPDGVSTHTYGAGNFYGTSASAPHVAGAAALLKSVNSSLTANQLQTVLEDTAVDLGTSGKDNLSGSGRIDVWDAFNSAIVNIPPVAYDDYYTTAEDTTRTVTAPGILTNDTDGDHDTLTAVKVTNPSHGTVTNFPGTGAFVYVPTSNYYGTDNFTYKAYDGTVYSNNATVHITITPVDDPPVVGDIPNQTITEGSTFTTINLDDYVSDVDNTDAEMTWTYSGNSQLTVSIVNRVATITIPNVDWYGAETITFRATDPSSLWDDDAAAFTVTPVNDPPAVSDIPDQTISEGSTFTTIHLDDYVSDPDNSDAEMTWTYSGNEQLTVSIVNRVATISIPNINWYGTETITFNTTDPLGLGDEDSAVFTVTSVNDVPVANFTYTPSEPRVDETVFFNDTSTDIDGTIISWHWDFGDGTTSTLRNTTHQFQDNISYIVTLNVTDNNDSIGSLTKQVVTRIIFTNTTLANVTTLINLKKETGLLLLVNTTIATTINVSRYSGNPSGENISNNITAVGTYIGIEVGNEGVIHWPLNISIFYTQDDLNNSHLNESQLLGIYFRNTTSGKWELYNNTGVNTTYNQSGYEGYCWADAWHLTLLASGGDNEAPSKVTGLTVTDAKDGKLNLAWTAATDNVAVDHYKIYRNNVFLINRTAISYQDTGLTNGHSYIYNVSAVDSSENEGNRSDSVSGTPTASGSGGNPPGNGGLTSGSSNDPPIANLSAGEPYIGFVGSPVTFDGSWSNDTDGNITKWIWNFGDGTNTSGQIVTHIYSEQGVYTVTLTVTDNENDTDSDTTTVVIRVQNRAPSNPTIDGPTTGHKKINYTFTVLSTDSNNDTIKYTFIWNDGVIESSEFLPNGTSWTRNHSWNSAGKYIITITATDNQTNSSSEKTILIDAVLVDNIGYLIDIDGDGTYDSFHNETNGQVTLLGQKDGSYLIDCDGDGQWEYIFDITTGLTSYTVEKGIPGFEFIFIMCAIFILILLLKKKKIV